ncbi:unnamed protein product [Camellia sinensis]
MASRRHVRYSRLAADEDNDYDAGGYDPRYDYTPKSFDKVPWKSIFLALFLLSLGCMLIFLSYFVFIDHMGGERSQAYGLLGLGILTFLPVDFMRLELHIIRGGVLKDITSLPSQIFEDMHNALELLNKKSLKTKATQYTGKYGWLPFGRFNKEEEFTSRYLSVRNVPGS